MTKYESAALEAIRMYDSKKTLDHEEIWENAVNKFTTSRSSITKGCPKGAFLGLCEEGLVKGIPPGCYTRNPERQVNKMYAIKAVDILKSKPNVTFNDRELWREVLDFLGIPDKQPQAQMKIVLILWNNKLIND